MNGNEQEAVAARGRLRSAAASVRVRAGAVEEQSAALVVAIERAVARISSISRAGGTVDAKHLEGLEQQAAELVEASAYVVTAVTGLVKVARVEADRVRQQKRKEAANARALGNRSRQSGVRQD